MWRGYYYRIADKPVGVGDVQLRLALWAVFLQSDADMDWCLTHSVAPHNNYKFLDGGQLRSYHLSNAYNERP